jgi:uncharacterized protein (TIGR02145 family)
MNVKRFSFSRLLIARIYISMLIMTVFGCDKDDNHGPLPTIPVVTTAALTNITTSGATGGGSIVSDGGAAITASGIVWSKTNATPTLDDSVIAGTTATGTFSGELAGLEDNASYYVRAFATNSIGTGYGAVVTLNTVIDTNKVRFIYNGDEVVYGIIVSPITGRRWLDRNVGAKQVATAVDDYLAYGDLFQWGRPADGHQLINRTSSTTSTPVNGTTTTLATSDIPGHVNFIMPPDRDTDPTSKLDWRDDNNSNRWMTSPQGPCPAGWHVPTLDEWWAETNQTHKGGKDGGMSSATTAYNQLRLTLSGLRSAFTTPYANAGEISNDGYSGWYWSSTDQMTPDGFSEVRDFEISISYAQPGFFTKAMGMSVRCIKD